MADIRPLSAKCVILLVSSAFMELTIGCIGRDKTQVTFWEIAFIVFGSAFALEEYTASTEHGWISMLSPMFLIIICVLIMWLSLYRQCRCF